MQLRKPAQLGQRAALAVGLGGGPDACPERASLGASRLRKGRIQDGGGHVGFLFVARVEGGMAGDEGMIRVIPDEFQ